MNALMKRFKADEDGATAIEYGLIATLIAVAIVAAVSSLGTATNGMYEEINDTMADAIE